MPSNTRIEENVFFKTEMIFVDVLATIMIMRTGLKSYVCWRSA